MYTPTKTTASYNCDYLEELVDSGAEIGYLDEPLGLEDRDYPVVEVPGLGYFGDKETVHYQMKLSGVELESSEDDCSQGELESIARRLCSSPVTIEVFTKDFQHGQVGWEKDVVQAVYWEDLCAAVGYLELPPNIKLVNAWWWWDQVRLIKD